jgi:hypothetical protein
VLHSWADSSNLLGRTTLPLAHFLCISDWRVLLALIHRFTPQINSRYNIITIYYIHTLKYSGRDTSNIFYLCIYFPYRHHPCSGVGGLLLLHLSQHGRRAEALSAGRPSGIQYVLTCNLMASVAVGISCMGPLGGNQGYKEALS